MDKQHVFMNIKAVRGVIKIELSSDSLEIL